VIPELNGKLNGFAVRAPVPTGSLVDLTVEVSARDERRGDQRALKAPRARAVRCGHPRLHRGSDRLSDIVKNPFSSIVDSADAVMDGTMVKVVAWYDNEWGYSNRVVDLVQRLL
jgi:glyceraldehyde 3-phosphate dehydrogenase